MAGQERSERSLNTLAIDHLLQWWVHGHLLKLASSLGHTFWGDEVLNTSFQIFLLFVPYSCGQKGQGANRLSLLHIIDCIGSHDFFFAFEHPSYNSDTLRVSLPPPTFFASFLIGIFQYVHTVGLSKNMRIEITSFSPGFNWAVGVGGIKTSS